MLDQGGSVVNCWLAGGCIRRADPVANPGPHGNVQAVRAPRRGRPPAKLSRPVGPSRRGCGSSESPETRVGKGSPSADASAAKKPPRSRPLPRPLTPHAKLELAPPADTAVPREKPTTSHDQTSAFTGSIRCRAGLPSDLSSRRRLLRPVAVVPGPLEMPREARRRTRARSPAATIGTPFAPPAPSPAPPASVQVTAPPTSLPRSSTQRGDQPDARFEFGRRRRKHLAATTQGADCRASDGCQLRAGWRASEHRAGWRASEHLEEASSTSTADAANWRSEDAPTRRAGTSVCGVPRSANCPQSAQVVLQSVIESR